MKKILAIMLIAVIAVAGVFATNHPEPVAPTSLVFSYDVSAYFQPGFAFVVTDADASDGVSIATDNTSYQSGYTQTFDVTPTNHDSSNPSIANSTDGIVANTILISIYDKSKSYSYVVGANQVDVELKPASTNWVWARTSGTAMTDGDEESTLTLSDISAKAATDITTTVDGTNAKKMNLSYGKTNLNNTNAVLDASTLVATAEVSWTNANVAPGNFTATLNVEFTVK